MKINEMGFEFKNYFNEDSAFEGVLLEFNMQFKISLKLFVHIHSFFVSDKTAHNSTVAAVTDIVISKNYCTVYPYPTEKSLQK